MIGVTSGWTVPAVFLLMILLPAAGAEQDSRLALKIEPPKEGVMLGRAFSLVFEMQGAFSGPARFPERPDLGPDFRVLGFVDEVSVEGDTLRRIYMVLPVRSGLLTVPSVFVSLGEGQSRQSNRAEVEVLSPIPSGSRALGKPDLLQTALPGTSDTLALLVIPLVLAIVLVAGFVHHRRKAHMPLPSPAPLPPHLEALRALDRLSGTVPETQKDSDTFYDAFYVTLSRILRKYASCRFHVNALKKTTGELDAALAGEEGLEDGPRVHLIELLREADLVKFTDRTSGIEGAGAALSRAKAFIESVADVADMAYVADVEDVKDVEDGTRAESGGGEG
jgi:hypothetical protein